MNTSSEISLIFTVQLDWDLSTVLRVFEYNGLTLHPIESRRSSSGTVEYLITFECYDIGKYLSTIHPIVETYCQYCKMIEGDSSQFSFPRSLLDLNVLSTETFQYGIELNSDHPGFKDEEYRQRRKFIVDLSANYQFGDATIPRIEYTNDEIETWNQCFSGLKKLYATHACREYLEISKDMFDQCGYRLDNVPQLEDVSQYISSIKSFQNSCFLTHLFIFVIFRTDRLSIASRCRTP